METVSSTGKENWSQSERRQGNSKGSFSWPVCQSEAQGSIYWVKRGGTNYIITNMCAARIGVCIREIYESQHRIKTIIHDYAVCGNNMIREQALCFVVRLHFKCTITSQALSYLSTISTCTSCLQQLNNTLVIKVTPSVPPFCSI